MANQTSPMMREISKPHRKLIQTIMKRDHGELSRTAYFRFNQKRLKSEISKYTGETGYDEIFGNVKQNDHCTDDEAAAIVCANMMSWDLLERGVARRLTYDDPAELECALSLGTRLDWLRDCQPRQCADSVYANIWAVFRGLAAGDLEVSQAYFRKGNRNLRGGHKPTVLTYNTVQAIINHNKRQQLILSCDIECINASNCQKAILETLSGIIAENPTTVAEELERVLSTFRRMGFFEHENIISLVAHGLAELAYWVSPKLLAEFNVDRSLPWDSVYYKWLRRKKRSVKYRDMSKHSALLHRWIHDLDEPGWWDARRK